MLPVTFVAVVAAGFGPLQLSVAPRVDADGFPLPPGAVARLGSSRFRAGDGGGQLMYSPDGSLLVGRANSSAFVWDAATGRLIRRIGNESVRSLGGGAGNLPAINPDAVWALGFDAGGALVVAWHGDLPAKPIFRPCVPGFADPSWDEPTDRDRPVLVQRVEARTGRVLGSVPVPVADQFFVLNRIVLSPDGAWVAYRVAYTDTLAVASVATGQERWRRAVRGLGHAVGRFTPDGRHLAWAQAPPAPAQLTVFDAATGKPAGAFAAFSENADWQFSPSGRWLVVSDGGVRVWDTTTRTVVFRPETTGASVIGGFVAPDLMVVGKSTTVAGDGMQVWDLKARKRVPGWEKTLGYHIALSPDVKTAAVAGSGNLVRVCDAATGQPRPVSCDLRNLSLSQDVLRGGFTQRGTLRLNYGGLEWNPRTGRFVVPPDGVADSDDPFGRTVITGENEKTLIFHYPGGPAVEIPLPPPDEISGYKVLHDGTTAVTWRRNDARGSVRTEISYWDTHTGKKRTTVFADGRATNLHFTPDGRRFVAEWWGYDWTTGEGAEEAGAGGQAGLRHLRVCDAVTGRNLGMIPGSDGLPSREQPHVISPDGRTVAVGYADGRLVVSEVASGRVRQVFRHNGPIFELDVSPNGRLLVAESRDAPILVWDLRGGLTDPPAPPPDAAALDAAWDALRSADARAAFAAIRALAAAPEQSLPFLKGKLTPATGPDPATVQKLIDTLGGDTFRDRERATEELRKLGPLAEPALRRALKTAASPEVARRVNGLLTRLDSGKLPPDDLRAVRAVEAVEWVGTPAAVKLLKSWAGGAEGARLTAEARAALARLRPH